MKREFWQERWDANRIGFHEGRPNAFLVQYAHILKGRVLVPLCGKAVDLQWLADRGHEVVGVEIIVRAKEEFFREHPESKVAILAEDIFSVKLDRFDSIYDRAALVALEPADRARYVARCKEWSDRILLLSLDYDQSITHGPPWSVGEKEVRALYNGWGAVEKLGAHEVPVPGPLASAGVTRVVETAYAIG